MRLSFLLATTLLIYNLSIDRSVAPVANALDDRTALLDPIQVNGLTLFPIVARDPDDTTGVLTLDEAMASRLVRVDEVDPARVDALQFANAADQPVFVLAGEVILGGKQDRVIAANTLIPPRTTQVIPVRCVEHGRWAGTTGELTTAGRLAHDRLRGTAAYGEQGDVWDEVARANQAHYTSNATQTYRDLAELQPANVATLAHRVDHALAEISAADRHRMIGYAVAYAGQVAAVDMFESPALFAKLERKLLHSYFADAVEIAREPARPPCVHAVRDFIANAKRGEAERSFTTELSSTLIQRGSLAATSQVEVGGRHLYSNYLGNVRVKPREPERRWICDRHLYPSYLGNQSVTDRCWDPPYPSTEQSPPHRLRRQEPRYQ